MNDPRLSPEFGGSRPVVRTDIAAWCDRCVVPVSVIPGGEPAELSDEAAVIIAAGHLSDSARTIVVTRMSRGLPIPTSDLITGATAFGDLRRIKRSVGAIDAQLRNPMLPSMVAPVLRSRRTAVSRKLEDGRKQVINGKGIFATSIRGIRRERRDGVHLELADREALFEALTLTPTPNVHAGGYMRRAGTVALDRLVGAMGSAAAKAGIERGRRWVSELTADTELAPANGEARFLDGYETILYVAGLFYDRVMRCPAWHSEHFELQRGAVDLNAELAEIAADVIALRTIRVDLDASRQAGGFDTSLDDHISRRETSLRPVWTQVVDRVSALASVAEVVESAAVELRVLAEFARTATIDDRIDRLVARSGDREISADNTKRLTEQVRAGEEQLRIYRDVLQGNIIRLSSGDSHRAGPMLEK
ncbi:hypothetical protein [Williamsia sp. CHRR-6]|uniref:hypothetical protein n=1 Tax=Williamsia sp. CHRR-6 TaxID=2835871 RepID=UPI001BD9183C|nr:hypothetical protein [Williamsia sp. CHRR-6]MBT0567378.1 hypothetical protein [Williamsia sp. CHRR-6]